MAEKKTVSDLKEGDIGRIQCSEESCGQDYEACKERRFLLVRVVRRDRLAVFSGDDAYFLNIDCGYPGTSYMDMPKDTPCEILNARLTVEMLAGGE